MQRAASVLAGSTADLWRGYVRLIGVERENTRLRKRLHQFERRATAQGETALMNRRLKRLLKLRRRLPTDAIAAEVTGRDPTVWFQSLTLDKGALDGLRPGMPVLVPGGIVGIVTSTSPHASRVMLVTDPNSGVDVLVQRTRARGIVSGLLEQGAILKYVKRTEDVQVGDRLVTSGLDGIFPKGLPVGHVTRVSRKDRGLFLYAEVMPAADASRIEEVLVAQAGGTELKPRSPASGFELVGPPDPAGLGVLGPPAPAAVEAATEGSSR
jgi:rod shape-determining protein MreC